MDGENNGKPYEQMDDLGVPLFLETPSSSYFIRFFKNVAEKCRKDVFKSTRTLITFMKAVDVLMLPIYNITSTPTENALKVRL